MSLRRAITCVLHVYTHSLKNCTFSTISKSASSQIMFCKTHQQIVHQVWRLSNCGNKGSGPARVLDALLAMRGQIKDGSWFQLKLDKWSWHGRQNRKESNQIKYIAHRSNQLVNRSKIWLLRPFCIAELRCGELGHCRLVPTIFLPSFHHPWKILH